jgi:hypothetical protein
MLDGLIEEFHMNPGTDAAYIAFEGDRRIASGDLREVAGAAKRALDREDTSVAVFDGSTSAPVELDLRGSLDQVLARLPDVSDASAAAADDAPPAPRGPGRPKLGVVAREITLLPRHWDWLAQQPGGASVAIRKLVDQARRSGEDKDRIRTAQEAAYRFMSVMARFICVRPGPFRKIDRGLAGRHPQPRRKTRRTGVSPRPAAGRRLIPRK